MNYTNLLSGFREAKSQNITLDYDVSEDVSTNVGGLMRKHQRRKAERKPSPQEQMYGYYMDLNKEEEVTRPMPRPGGPLPEVDNPLAVAREAIAAVESRGSGDYAAIGPVVEKGMYEGQRAYGRYQVMEGNIGPWTKKALGKEMTKEEFLASEAAQDAVVEWKLQQDYKKYGTWEDAASVWFSGRPVDEAGNADDGFTSVPEYITKFQNAYRQMADSYLVDVSPTAEEGEVPAIGIMQRRTK